jgi:hypothetical protein
VRGIGVRAFHVARDAVRSSEKLLHSPGATPWDLPSLARHLLLALIHRGSESKRSRIFTIVHKIRSIFCGSTFCSSSWRPTSSPQAHSTQPDRYPGYLSLQPLATRTAEIFAVVNENDDRRGPEGTG